LALDHRQGIHPRPPAQDPHQLGPTPAPMTVDKTGVTVLVPDCFLSFASRRHWLLAYVGRSPLQDCQAVLEFGRMVVDVERLRGSILGGVPHRAAMGPDRS
jgi:hypothetical protein